MRIWLSLWNRDHGANLQWPVLFMNMDRDKATTVGLAEHAGGIMKSSSFPLCFHIYWALLDGAREREKKMRGENCMTINLDSIISKMCLFFYSTHSAVIEVCVCVFRFSIRLHFARFYGIFHRSNLRTENSKGKTKSNYLSQKRTAQRTKENGHK